MKKYNNKYIEQFESFLLIELNYSPNTISSYLLDIEQFFLLNKKDILALDEKDVREYLIYLDNNFKSSTKGRKISALKKFYLFLNLEYDIENIFERIKGPKKEKTIPKYLSQKDLYKLLDSVPTSTKIDIRDKAMLEILYASGMRISELLNLETKNIKLDEKFVRILGKGNKERIVPINNSSAATCKKYLEVRIQFMRSDTNIFFLNAHGKQMSRQGFTKILKQRAALVGLKDISAHKLRHSIATHLLDNGADLVMIQNLLGHKNISTTEIYTHVSKDRVVKEYNKYFDDSIVD